MDIYLLTYEIHAQKYNIKSIKITLLKDFYLSNLTLAKLNFFMEQNIEMFSKFSTKIVIWKFISISCIRSTDCHTSLINFHFVIGIFISIICLEIVLNINISNTCTW